MKTNNAAYILATAQEDRFADSWFIGQLKWTAELARKVLQYNDAIQKKNGSDPEAEKACGLIFKKDMSEVDAKMLRECDRIFIFNRDRQLSAVQIEQDGFQMAITEKADKESDFPAQSIKDKGRYSFAYRIGSIPDITGITVKIPENPENNSWRFSHV